MEFRLSISVALGISVEGKLWTTSSNKDALDMCSYFEMLCFTRYELLFSPVLTKKKKKKTKLPLAAQALSKPF